MKNNFLLASGLSLLFAACHSNKITPVDHSENTLSQSNSSSLIAANNDATAPTRFNHPKQNLINSNNTFALDLYKKIYTADKNQFISPYSISSALAMTYAGAVGITETEIAKTMHFAKNTPEFHKSFGDLQGTINKVGSNDKITIKVANKLFGSLKYQFKEPFLKNSKDYYGGGFDCIDMLKPDLASKTINNWVENKTNNQIKDFLKPSDITPETHLVLVNAIYFLGNWANAFNEMKTVDYNFVCNKTETVKSKMMHAHQKDRSTFKVAYQYHENELGQWLELPYSNNQASMVVLLPKAGEDLAKVIAQLTSEKLEKSLKSLAKPVVGIHIRLPKWKTTYDLKLNEALINMGMPTAFSDAATFSLMSEPGQIPLKIGAVLHKAFVDVSEKGTEASAASVIAMLERSLESHIQPIKEIIFTADRPFVYFIKERSTGSILFMGTLQNPNKE